MRNLSLKNVEVYMFLVGKKNSKTKLLFFNRRRMYLENQNVAEQVLASGLKTQGRVKVGQA